MTKANKANESEQPEDTSEKEIDMGKQRKNAADNLHKNKQQSDQTENPSGDESDKTNTQSSNDSGHPALKAQVQKMGLSFDDVKQGLERLLPFIEAATALTENSIDNAALTFLKQLLGK